MSYASEKLLYGREKIQIVEVELNYCANTFGIAPCTATGSGDAKCFNTLETTQDLPNYVDTTKIYRFCTQRSPHPIGLSGTIPSIVSLNVTPSQIDVKGGFGVRASGTVTFTDNPHSDIDVDKYATERTWIASDRGTFWTKLRARNPNYQFKALRVLTGYLVNGEFLAENFQTQHFVIDKLNVSNGQATITFKDPLKLAMSKKAQAPAPSTGLLNAGITNSATSATLTPTGVGNLEYAASGFILIKSEIMSFTRSADVLTIVRGLQGTTAIAHSANDTVQQCLEYSGATRGQLDFIVNDLLTNFANLSSTFIPLSAWDSEVDTYLSGLLDGIIPKPMDVFKIIKELMQAMPFYLSWDERDQEVDLTALKAPPASADVLDMDGNLVADSVKIVDRPDMRKSTIFINFDMQNKAKNLDDVDNWGQTYVRIDQDSINKYGGINEVEVISSRWISGTNKATALQSAALIGRRFSDIPRQINFSLDAKDDAVWLGQIKSINHRDMVDATGIPVDTMFQITSAGESDNFNYQGLEFKYGAALPEDEGGGDPDVDLIIISVDDQNINLRTIFNGLFPAPDATTQAKFVIQNGVVIGSSSVGTIGIDTGLWPAGATVTLQLDSGGYSVGKGGDGQGIVTPAAEAGGTAIILNFALELINNGIIGGGGGGGGYGTDGDADAAGGGGAGNSVGTKGTGTAWGGSGSPDIFVNPSDGSLETGGGGGRVVKNVPESIAVGGGGGALGVAGTNGGSGTAGVAGVAIDKNGFVLTETVTGDIRGAILT